MRVNEATTILAIFFAILELKKQDRNQSEKNILDFFGAAKISPTTVKKNLDQLENWGSVTRLYNQRGKARVYIKMRPERIPSHVYSEPIKPSTKSRWKYKYQEETNLAKLDDGDVVFDAEGFANSIPQETITKLVNEAKNQEEPNIKDFSAQEAKQFFIDCLKDEKFDFSDGFLEDFHRWLCSEVAKFYADT